MAGALERLGDGRSDRVRVEGCLASLQPGGFLEPADVIREAHDARSAVRSEGRVGAGAGSSSPRPRDSTRPSDTRSNVLITTFIVNAKAISCNEIDKKRLNPIA